MPYHINPYLGVAYELEFLQGNADVSPGSSSPYTFSSVNFGAAHSNRQIVVTAGLIIGNQALITAMTIGGVSATVWNNDSNDWSTTAIGIADVPTGTSGNVVVTFDDNSAEEIAIATYRGINVSTTAYSSDTNNTRAQTQNFSLNTPAGKSTIIACASSDSSGGSGSSSGGLTTDYEQNTGGHHFISSQQQDPGEETPSACAITVTSGNERGVAVCFQPK